MFSTSRTELHRPARNFESGASGKQIPPILVRIEHRNPSTIVAKQQYGNGRVTLKFRVSVRSRLALVVIRAALCAKSAAPRNIRKYQAIVASEVQRRDVRLISDRR